MPKIIQHTDADHKVLRAVAPSVPLSDIGSKKLEKIVSDMVSALRNEADGVAIAAPQIGVSLRIFVVSGHILAEIKSVEKREPPKGITPLPDMVFINPKITRRSREKEDLEEGCLSVRPLYGFVSRSKRVTVTAIDMKGKKFERGASGLLAQIFQHETEHLDGMLFIDKAKDIHEINYDKDK